MQAELKKDGKIMMCEACDHVFHFSHRPGSVQSCPSCKVSLYRARAEDFIATKHEYAERKETPLLAEVIRPRFEKKLLLSELPSPKVEEGRKKATSVKVCDKCFTIQDLVEGEPDKPCPTCFPHENKAPEPVQEVLEVTYEDVEYVAIDLEEREEEREVVTEAEEVFPDKKPPEVISESPAPQEETQELSIPTASAPLIYTSFSLANVAPSSHIDFNDGGGSVAAPLFKKSNTELASAYTQIKLPVITGALVENDIWSNFRKQTVITSIRDKLQAHSATQVKAPPSRNEDIFLYQIRQVVSRYFFLSLCLIGTVGVVVWSLTQTF